MRLIIEIVIGLAMFAVIFALMWPIVDWLTRPRR